MHNINGKTKIVSLLAKNTDHSLSPLIHNFSLKHLNINSVYIPTPFAGESISSFLKVAHDIGLQGFNVTVPFKEDVATELGLCGESINTVYREEGSWKGVSTDAEGFCLGLKRMNKSIEDFENIVFLGNGGASLAIVKYIYDMYDKNIFVLRRNRSRDDKFPKELSFHDFDTKSLASLLKTKKNTLLVQSTSAPLYGNSLKELCPAIEFLDGAFVDLVYKNPSDLFYEAERHGLPCIDGLPMLVEQAVLSQKYWWGTSVDSSLVYDFIDRYGV